MTARKRPALAAPAPAGKADCGRCGKRRYLPDGQSCATCTRDARKEAERAEALRTYLRHVERTYGVTPEQYMAMHKAQGGRCAICRRVRSRLGVDHNHLTGLVRGLVCVVGDKSCNRMIGWAKHDPAMFDRAAEYLRCPPAVAVIGVVQTPGRAPVELITGAVPQLVAVDEVAA